MADSDPLDELAGIDARLAELAELGKQMAGVTDAARMAELQARFHALVTTFTRQVEEANAALAAAGLVPAAPAEKPRVDLDPELVEEVYARTGETIGFVELEGPPPRPPTRDELLALALAQACKPRP